MSRAFLIFLVTIFAVSSLCARSKHCTFRVHAQANEHDGEVFANPVTAPVSGKNIFIEKIPTISEQNVIAFRPVPASNGTFGAVVQLDDHGRLALDTLSIEHRGTTLIVVVNGRPVTELLVDRRVSDGQIYIPSGLTAADIDLMRRSWRPMDAPR